MLTPATITVSFIANYAGLHRICWRQCGVGNYACTNIVECEGGGNPCNAVIPIMVDPESCDPVCFEGYIQATCNAIDSGTGQVPFTVTYTPNPTCVGWTITCDNPEGCVAISPIEIGLNCDGSLRPTINALATGEKISICNRFELTTLPADYSIALDPTVECCTCQSYVLELARTKPGPVSAVLVYYVDCNKTLQTVTFPTEFDVIDICAVPGSINLTGSDSFSLTVFDGSATCP